MDEFEWNVVNEGQLLDAMVGHKPVGISKNFQMIIICEKLAENLKKWVDPEKIWAHLGTLYNLKALDENEAIPFPNEEREFQLPDIDFGELKQRKLETTDEKKNQKGRETPKSVKEINKKDETKLQNRSSKDIQMKDTNKDIKITPKKEVKKELDKPKQLKGKTPTIPTTKEEVKPVKVKLDETPKQSNQRTTRGSLKPDEPNNGGKASPVTVTPGNTKRRRI